MHMIQVAPLSSAEERWHTLGTNEEHDKDVRLLQLLSEFNKLFEEPTKLPLLEMFYCIA